MADYFQTGGACSGSWWSTERTGGLDGLEMAASVSCSTLTSDIGGSGGAGFSWAASELVEGKALSSDEPTGSCSGSGSSITFPDSQKAQAPDQMTGGGSLMDSTLHMASFGLSSPSMDWNQTLLRSSGSGQPSFHAILQESNQGHTGGTEDFASNPYKDMNQGFPVDQQHLSTVSEPGIPLVPPSYRCSSLLLQGLLEPENKLQQSPYDNRSVNFQSSVAYRSGSSELLQQPLWTRYPQLLTGSLPKQPVANQLQFSNSTPFWNASVGATTELRSSFYPPVPSQFIAQPFEQKPILTNLTSSKGHQGGARDSSSGVKKSMTDQPAFKKPRIETPSPLPTFKVRKEKLGDRITALQQLVSPFGKTDTASVLHEAIEYIKFLHDQVRVLSTPYLKNGHPMQHQQNPDTSKDGEGLKQDLGSRGLCLVPIASTFPVESETTAEFWTPTFGGTYR